MTGADEGVFGRLKETGADLNGNRLDTEIGLGKEGHRHWIGEREAHMDWASERRAQAHGWFREREVQGWFMERGARG